MQSDPDILTMLQEAVGRRTQRVSQALSVESALPLQSEPAVSSMRRFAFLLLAFAVFGFGLQARLALYSPNPPVEITSAKLSTERRSAEALRSLEARNDELRPATQVVLSLLFNGFCDVPNQVLADTRVDIVVSNSTRSQLSCVTSLRRPPPSAI